MKFSEQFKIVSLKLSAAAYCTCLQILSIVLWDGLI
jgi:hypothetical protein